MYFCLCVCIKKKKKQQQKNFRVLCDAFQMCKQNIKAMAQLFKTNDVVS